LAVLAHHLPQLLLDEDGQYYRLDALRAYDSEPFEKAARRPGSVMLSG
jgi:hypothetical protein